MIEKIFKYSYLLFVIATIALTGFLIGPFSLRIPFGLLCACTIFLSNYRLRIDLNIKLYAWFGIIFIIALLFNGELSQFNTVNYFLGKVFLGIVMYYATDKYIKSAKSVDSLMLLFFIIGMINSVSSILQNFKLPLGDVIALALSRGSAEEAVGFSQSEMMSYYTNALTIGVPGIFPDRVSNGYFASFSVFVSIYLLIIHIRRATVILYIVATGLNITALFFSQQRSALALTIVLCLFLIFKRLNFRNPKVILCTVISIILGLIFVTNLPTSEVDVGRYNNYTDGGRDRIYTTSFEFIKSHFFFGGPTTLAKNIKASVSGIVSPHNFFLTAFGYAGIFGGMVISLLYLRMILTSFLIINDTSRFACVGCMLLMYLLNSLFHNGGLMEGEGMIWLLYMVILRSSIDIRNMNYTR